VRFGNNAVFSAARGYNFYLIYWVEDFTGNGSELLSRKSFRVGSVYLLVEGKLFNTIDFVVEQLITDTFSFFSDI
jgi:hypothetical protein